MDQHSSLFLPGVDDDEYFYEIGQGEQMVQRDEMRVKNEASSFLFIFFTWPTDF